MANQKTEKQPGAEAALPTPPATPMISQLQVRSDLRMEGTGGLPTPPSTPDVHDFAALNIDASSSNLEPILASEAMTIEVLARPTNTFPMLTLDVGNGSRSLFPVDYHRWPFQSDRSALENEIHPISDGSWRIGHGLFRSIVTGKSKASSSELQTSLLFMTSWLGMMEVSALDIGYDAKEWTDTCRKTWAALAGKGPSLPLRCAQEMLRSLIRGEELKRGRMSHADEPGAKPNYDELLQASIGIPTIQFQPVSSVSVSLLLETTNEIAGNQDRDASRTWSHPDNQHSRFNRFEHW